MSKSLVLLTNFAPKRRVEPKLPFEMGSLKFTLVFHSSSSTCWLVLVSSSSFHPSLSVLGTAMVE